ncbi:unnamed protein product [Lampetra planeri]
MGTLEVLKRSRRGRVGWSRGPRVLPRQADAAPVWPDRAELNESAADESRDGLVLYSNTWGWVDLAKTAEAARRETAAGSCRGARRRCNCADAGGGPQALGYQGRGRGGGLIKSLLLPMMVPPPPGD